MASIKVLGSSSKGNCYLIQTKDSTLILECGISFKEILKGLNFNLKNVVGCLVTHEHKDHSKSVKDMCKNGINVYMTNGTKIGCNIGNHRINTIALNQQFEVGKFKIIPFSIIHDVNEPCGFLIYHKSFGKLLFITDTGYIPVTFNGINHLLIEDNYLNSVMEENLENKSLNSYLARRIKKTHLEHSQSMKFIKQNSMDLMNVMLIHLSDANSCESIMLEDAKQTAPFSNCYIGAADLEIEINATPF